MKRNRRIGSSLKSRMPMTNPLMSKSLISGAVVFFVAFFAAFISSSVLTPTRVSDAANLTTANVAFTGYFVKLNSSDVTMNLLTTPTGSMTVVSSTVKTVTNSPNGYKLYLSMSSEDTSGNEKSFNDKLKNGLYLDGNLSRTDGMLFAPASGKGGSTATAFLAPLTDNTWGYAVDKNSTGAPDIWLNEDHSTMGSATPTSDKFAAVPKATEVDLIQETNSSTISYETTESEVQDSDYTDANLYYGIRGTAILEGGSYTNTIAYTAVGKTEPAGTLAFNPLSYVFDAPYESMVWDDTVTIQTPLYTSAEDLGTATVTLSGGPDNVSGLSCSNPSLTIHNNLLNVTCTLPQAKAGTYDVVVYLDKYGQIYTGSYTYSDPYSQSYALTISNNNTSTPNVQSISIPYGGTATIEVIPNDGYYLSSVVCPNGYTCNFPTGMGARTVTITNNNTASDGTVTFVGALGHTIANSTYMQEVNSCPDFLDVGIQYTLKDQGEPSKSYTVAKLDDGKCWMTQNYNVSGGKTLTSAYYDVDSNYTLPASSSSYAWSDNSEPAEYVYNDSTYGGYYTYGAVTASTGLSLVSGEASSSICPKGWRLPTTAEFNTLRTIYVYSDTFAADPVRMIRSGRFSPGQYYVGIYGWFLSSTTAGQKSSYVLSIYEQNTALMESVQKNVGHTVRCIFGSHE